MGVTFEIRDPETGERALMHAYRKRGRTVIRRLPKHLLLDYATERRLDQIAAFSSAAASAFDSRGRIDGLPTAAAAVRRLLTSEVGRSRKPKTADGSRQERLRLMIPADQLANIDALAALPVRIRLEGILPENGTTSSKPRAPPSP